MPRIRTVKPDLFRHEELFEAEISYNLPLRIAFVGLFTCCDREGRFRWKPRILKLDILPFDDIDFTLVLEALVNSGFIQKYIYDGKEYGIIPSWHRHQVINSKEQNSTLPKPGTQNDTTTNNSSTIIREKTASPITPSSTDNQLACIEEDEFNTLNRAPSLINDTHSASLKNTQQVTHLVPISRVVHAWLTREARVSHALTTRNQDGISSLGSSQGEEEREQERNRKGNREQEILAQDNEVVRGVAISEKEKPARLASVQGKADKQPFRLKAVPLLDIQNIFNFWCHTMKQPFAKLDKHRRQKILDAKVMGYTNEELRQAILGCASTPYNMGNNDRGEVFNGLHIIFRDANQIDRFINHYHHPPLHPTHSRKMQQNLSVVQNWVKKKMTKGF